MANIWRMRMSNDSIALNDPKKRQAVDGGLHRNKHWTAEKPWLRDTRGNSGGGNRHRPLLKAPVAGGNRYAGR